MADPLEGVAADGTIVTGATRAAVRAPFEPLLSSLVARFADWPQASAYLYGSVATGQARIGRSDVDLMTIDLPRDRVADLAAALHSEFRALSRGIEIAPARAEDLVGDSDEAYGNRVFLRHYCVHLAGPDHRAALPAYPADARAARGFNGDLGRHLDRWRRELHGDDPGRLGRRVGRKTLLAVAGLLSVCTSTWTTDRVGAARDHGRRRPELAGDLARLLAWASDDVEPERAAVQSMLGPDGCVEQVVEEFSRRIGLWPDAG